MNTLWIAPALACYALASAAFLIGRWSQKSRFAVYAVSLLGAGAVFHALDLVARGLQAGNIPVANFSQSLSFLAWLLAIASLVLIVRLRMEVIGAFVAPAVMVASAAAYEMMRGGRLVLPETLRSVWLPIHVSLAFLGDALFVLAAVVSLVYLVYESRLKAKRPLSAVAQGPSLEKLDRINYHLLVWGFVMLSLAILSGAIWADATWGHFWSWEPRESWSLLTWLLYAGLLESRLTVGWRGRRAATLTIAVFAVLVGSFLGVSLVFPGKHGGSFG
ncbi:MAG: c-type cytochrome biogenesis protein CcsB [Candidatus Binataceae bacterium]